MNILNSIARVRRETAFLLVLGAATGASGAWLLYTAPVGLTDRALAGIETRMEPRTVRAGVLPVAAQVATSDDAMLVSLQRGRAADDAADAVSIEVRAQVSGRIASVRSPAGSYVAKGATLFELDPAPFVAAVGHAEHGGAEARARLAVATAELGRAQRAFDDGTIDTQALDARVRAQREAHGALRTAAALLESARHAIALTRIVAPIAGRVAAVRVDVGDRVAAAPEGRSLITIVPDDPVFAEDGDEGARVRLALLHRGHGR